MRRWRQRSTPEGETSGEDWVSVWNMTGAHLLHDMYLGFLGILLPFLRDEMGFSLFLAGLLLPARQAGSALQPVLGHMADNVGRRRFVIVFLAVTAVSLSLMGPSPNYLILIGVLVIGGLSSAAYHPAGSALVTGYAGDRWGTSLAIYHFGGNIGLAVGPLAAALVVSEMGLDATWILAVPGVLWAVWLRMRLRETPLDAKERTSAKEAVAWIRKHGSVFGLLFVIILGRAIGAGGITLFLPTLLEGRGLGLAVIAVLTSGFFIVGGLGGLVSGWLSDRLGRKVILGSMLAITSFALFGFLMTTGPLSVVFLLLAASGLTGAQPVVMAIIQEWSPARKGTVVGIALGGQFVLQGIGTALVGLLADSIGLEEAFRLVALVPLLALPVLKRLPLGALDSKPSNR